MNKRQKAWRVLLITLAFGAAGCASQPEVQMCFVQVVGRTLEGLTIMQQLCMTSEQFAAETKVEE